VSERARCGLADAVRMHAPAFLAGRAVPSVVRQALRDIERCKTAALGGHVYACDSCQHSHIAYNSCRNRNCPRCCQHKSYKWVEARELELLPVPYFHLVFTLPKELRGLALRNQALVYGLLFRAASEAMQDLAKDTKHLGASIGFIAVLHTWGQNLMHHPHVHCVVPGGGISLDGERWVHCRKRFFLPVRPLSALFRGKMLAFLHRAAKRGDLVGVDEDGMRDLTAPLFAKKWVVYAKRPFGGPKQVLRYLARYTHRVAISDSRILAVGHRTVTFAYKDYRDSQKKTMSLQGRDFLRRFSFHVLPRGFTRLRSFGLLANNRRAKNLARCRDLLGATPPQPKKPENNEDVWRRCPACETGVLLCLSDLPPCPTARDTS
jgi:hypothetical protein